MSERKLDADDLFSEDKGASSQGYFSGGNSDVASLQKKIEQRDAEIFQIKKMFAEYKDTVANIEQTKDNLELTISTLETKNVTLETKLESIEDQTSTLKESIEMKNEAIKVKDEKIKMKEQKISELKTSLLEKESKLKELEGGSIDKSVVEEKEKEIKDLQNLIVSQEKHISELEEEAKILSEDMTAADEQIDSLHKEKEEIKAEFKEAQKASSSGVLLNNEQVLANMKEYLEGALHNVYLTVPTITDLVGLEIFEVKSTVKLNISTSIMAGNPEHEAMVDEFEVFDNIALRLYEDNDRYSISVDGAVLFLCSIGEKKDEILSILTEDHQQIKMFQNLAMESWLRAKKM